MSLGMKRLLVWVVSMVIGFVVTVLLIGPGFDSLPLFSSIEDPQGVSVQEYGYMYFLVTAVPIGLIAVIWLDYFMDTGILPD